MDMLNMYVCCHLVRMVGCYFWYLILLCGNGWEEMHSYHGEEKGGISKRLYQQAKLDQ